MTNHTLSLNTGIFGDTYTYVGSAHLNQWHAERAERQQQAARAKAALRQQTREQEALELSAQGTARVDHWFQNSARRQPAAQGTAGMAWMDHWSTDTTSTGLQSRWAALRARWARASADAELRRVAEQDPRVMRDLQVMSDLAEWNPALR